METIAIIMFGLACFAAGMYFTSQLGDWIDRRIKKRQDNEQYKNHFDNRIDIFCLDWHFDVVKP